MLRAGRRRIGRLLMRGRRSVVLGWPVLELMGARVWVRFFCDKLFSAQRMPDGMALFDPRDVDR